MCAKLVCLFVCFISSLTWDTQSIDNTINHLFFLEVREVVCIIRGFGVHLNAKIMQFSSVSKSTSYELMENIEPNQLLWKEIKKDSTVISYTLEIYICFILKYIEDYFYRW